MKALGEIIVVRPLPTERVKGKIIIKTRADQYPDRGVVLEVGKEVDEIKKGDTILFRKANATFANIDGEDVLLMIYKSAYVIL